MIYQGSTPKFTITPSISIEILSKIRCILKNGQYCITRELTENDFNIKENNFMVNLTQDETLKLDSRLSLDIQLHMLTKDDEAIVSDLKRVAVEELLYREVIK